MLDNNRSFSTICSLIAKWFISVKCSLSTKWSHIAKWFLSASVLLLHSTCFVYVALFEQSAFLVQKDCTSGSIETNTVPGWGIFGN